MNLEKKVFLFDRNARKPSENLAINKICFDLVRDGDYDLIGRAYYHSNGVILGTGESIYDVNKDFCLKNEFEVVRRPSGGSAILVMPELTLCYSLFFKSVQNPDSIYKLLTIPLAKKLGSSFSVEGAYYIRVKSNDKKVPFAGHAIKKDSFDIVQFDGVVNKDSFDIELLSKVLKLRKLYEVDGRKFVLIGEDTFDLNGNKIKVDNTRFKLLRDETEELKSIIGLRNIEMSDDFYVGNLFSVVQQVFGNVLRINNLAFDENILKEERKKIITDLDGGKFGLGHCFVDFIEPEPRIHYGI